MEFFKPHTGNEENRRLNEGNAIASALDNFNSGEFFIVVVQSLFCGVWFDLDGYSMK